MATQDGQLGSTETSTIQSTNNEKRQDDSKISPLNDSTESSEIAADSASIKNDGTLSRSLSSDSSMEPSDLTDIQKTLTSNNGTHSNNNANTERSTTSHTWRSRMNSFANAEEIQLYYLKQQEQHMRKKLYRKSTSESLVQDTNLLDRVPLKKGYLYWLDKKKNKWTLRWFELSGGILMHYHSQDSELVEMVSLQEDPVTLQEHENAKIPFCFEIITVTDELILRAESDKEMQEWLNEIVKHRFHSHSKNEEEQDDSAPTFKSIAVKSEEEVKPNLGPTVKIHTHTLRRASTRDLPPINDTASDPGKPSRKSTNRIRPSKSSSEEKSRSRASNSLNSVSAPGTLNKNPTAPSSSKRSGIFKMMPSLSSSKSKTRAITVSSTPALKSATTMFQARNVSRSVSDSELATILLNQGPNVRVTWNEVAHKFPRGWKPPKPKDPKPPPPPFPNPNPRFRSRRGTDVSTASGTSSNENDSRTTDEHDSSYNDSSSVSSEVTDDSNDVDVPQSKSGPRAVTRVPSTCSSPAKLQS